MSCEGVHAARTKTLVFVEKPADVCLCSDSLHLSHVWSLRCGWLTLCFIELKVIDEFQSKGECITRLVIKAHSCGFTVG